MSEAPVSDSTATPESGSAEGGGMGSAAVALARLVGPPALALALLFTAWEAWVRLRDVREYLLPAPSAVARALADDPGRYLDAASATLVAAAGGLLIATTLALALAIAMAHSRAIERALYPPALLLKLTPIVAVYPLFTIWFGFGLWPKMLVAAMITFFPTLVNAVIGLRSVDPAALDALRSLDASPAQLLWRLRLPSSLPYLFAALRISVPLALIGAVVAEFLSGDGGMGQLILIANGDLDTATLFAAVAVLVTMGVTLTAVLAYGERRVLFWHASTSDV
jgi:NitT/TauT family transport system permease protein